MSLTKSFLRLVADVGTQSIHGVFLLVRLLAVTPFVQPLLGSLLVQWIKNYLRWSMASGGWGGLWERRANDRLQRRNLA